MSTPPENDGRKRRRRGNERDGAADRAAILRAIRDAGAFGLTDHEGERLLRIMPQSYTPRRLELEKAGAIRRTARRRPTYSGRPAIVWIAAEPDAREAGA